MTVILSIARRELQAFFASPIGWISLTAFTVISGFFFTAMLLGYAEASTQAVLNPMMGDGLNVNEWVIQPFFGNLAVIMMLLTPALTMRLIAEDRRQRAIELLLTSPISSTQIVLGKFMGVLGFVAVLMLFTLHIPALLYWKGDPDTGVFLANYLSFFLITATFMAIGLFASALTENQIVALTISFGLNLMMWVLSWATQGAGDGAIKTVIEYLSMLTHIDGLSKGLLHLKDFVYFFTFIGFFLFATTQRVEALRWR